MKNENFDDFTTQIQSDEIASIGGKPGGDWINDFEDNGNNDDDDFVDD